ncbi:MAG: guanylate kinase [Pseudomonadota bacterium]
MSETQYLGTLFTVSAPSGAGKTTLVKEWLAQDIELVVSVSYTTRSQRDGEVDGENYHFVTHDEFEKMIQDDAFFEYAEVFNNYYGSAKSSVFDQLKQGLDVVLEIDWQGAQQVKEAHPETVSIFILPPSYEELEERLTSRGREQRDEIGYRLEQAKEEMAHYAKADYLIINDHFELALSELCTIHQTQQLRTSVQEKKHKELIQGLLE